MSFLLLPLLEDLRGLDLFFIMDYFVRHFSNKDSTRVGGVISK